MSNPMKVLKGKGKSGRLGSADAPPTASPMLRTEPASPSRPCGSVPTGAEDFNEVWDNRPAAPTCDKPIEVDVVGRRCIYVNSCRIAGGKPYVSENLPSHTLKTTLGQVLDAFREDDILLALAEKRARREYIAAYHERKRARGQQ